MTSHGRRTSYLVSAPLGTILSIPAGATSGDVASTDRMRRGTSVGEVLPSDHRGFTPIGEIIDAILERVRP